MASYEKRGKTWQYNVSRYINGVYKPIRKGGFRTKGEARAEAIQIEDRLRKSKSGFIFDEPFEEFFLDWVDLYKKNIAKITRKSYDLTHSLIKEHFGKRLISSITARDYQGFINKIGETRGFESISRIHIHIRSCVRIALNENLINSNFTYDTELFYAIPQKKEEDKFINFKDAKKLLNYLTNNLEKSTANYLILLALTSGLRFGELVGLTRSDFDFKKKCLYIDKTWGYHTSSANPADFGSTKNEQSVRTVSLDDITLKIYKDLFENASVHEDNEDELVFFSPTATYKVISNSFINRHLKKVLSKLKIKPEISIHGLRHTHASILIYKKTVSINYISERLGHSSVVVTLDRYSHVLEELRDEEVQETNKIISAMFN